MNRKKNIGNRNFGQSLFEVIVALAVAALFLTGIVSLTSKSVSNATSSKNKSFANNYARDVIEYARKEKEFNGWVNFRSTVLAGSGLWCMTTLSFNNNFACVSTNPAHFINGTIFQRNVTITETIANRSLDIDVTVSWNDEKGRHETRTVSTISNW